MRRILRTILFLAVLCLTGCSSEDPQSVAFSVKEIEVGPDATRMSITIEANCPWTVTDEKDKTFTEIKQGSGTVETPFIVFTNPDYETKQYTVTVTSEDGTSTDVLTVTQGEAFGLEAGKASPVAAEGGAIDIPVRTNDQIDNIETPEWISFTSSRALTGYTYTFTAEPNKTGSPRTGYIVLEGKNYTGSRIEVKQDSYAPTGVIIEGLPTKTVEKNLSFAVQLEPSYADWDKLNITSDNASNVWLNGQTASVELKEYGKSTINFYGDGKEIYSTQVERFPSKILPYSDDINVYWGEEFFLSYNYKSDDYVVKIKNPEIIKPEEDGKLKAADIGASTITVRHEELGLEDKVTVWCDWTRITAEISHFDSTGDDYKVKIGAIVEFQQPAEVSSFMVTDRKSNRVLFNQGKITQTGNGAKIITEPISIKRTEGMNAQEAVKGYTFHVNVHFKGEKEFFAGGGTVINHQRSGYIK